MVTCARAHTHTVRLAPAKPPPPKRSFPTGNNQSGLSWFGTQTVYQLSEAIDLPTSLPSSLPSGISTYAALPSRLPGMLSGWGGASMRNVTGLRLVASAAAAGTPPVRLTPLTLRAMALLAPILLLLVLLLFRRRPPPHPVCASQDGAPRAVWPGEGWAESGAGDETRRPTEGRQGGRRASNLDLI
mmetsp:Transcript_26068/g.82599  ORF Transcript_26068/g.82599 Transcript_26068/m.82599 type:complete len:186 (+) Transcript_26068:192-749(+)